jgi:hypothetical protein
MADIETLQARLLEYEKRMGIGEHDPAKEGYLVLVNILKQQNEYLKDIKIKELLTKEDKSKAVSVYERSKALWEGLPKMIESVSNLKVALKMEGENKKDIYKPISAKEIANGNV